MEPLLFALLTLAVPQAPALRREVVQVSAQIISGEEVRFEAGNQPSARVSIPPRVRQQRMRADLPLIEFY
ncbi:hypothetical protein [Sphingorhabdus sp.]|jgi:hypothetical protein|uniref:hypothetical protein n=1 Tax=Sphingorhabdus sp. TaxID=1902408 RepID=UPI003BAEA137|nr:hypothetical protein [Sphingomonadales bacterium]